MTGSENAEAPHAAAEQDGRDPSRAANQIRSEPIPPDADEEFVGISAGGGSGLARPVRCRSRIAVCYFSTRRKTANASALAGEAYPWEALAGGTVDRRRVPTVSGTRRLSRR